MQRELFPSHPVVRTADCDQARDAVTRLYLTHRLELLHRSARLDMRLNAVRLGAVTAGYLRYGSDVRIVTAEAAHYHINIPLHGDTECWCGAREPVRATPGRAVVFMPGVSVDMHWPAGCAQLCVMITRDELERELERLLGRPLTHRLRFPPGMDLTTPAAQTWLAALDVLEQESARPDGLVRHPLGAAHLQHLLVHGLLLAQPHSYRDESTNPLRAAQPRAIRQAVELVQNHPERPWSTTKLAQQVAVSARCLQEGFQRYLGMPPMTYLREVRLLRVHGELREADPDTVTVGAVASRWGFLHAGRFAAAYKRKFGCSPSASLRG